MLISTVQARGPEARATEASRAAGADSSTTAKVPEIPPVAPGECEDAYTKVSSWRAGGSIDRGGSEMELSLQGTGIVVRQDINSEKIKSPSAVLRKCRRSY